MSYHLAPIANAQQLDANGNPLSGGKIHTYIAGTSTPAPTYADDSGAAAQTNPIILNSRGVPANPVWLQGGRSYKLVISDANDVVLQTIDDVTGINDVTGAVDQWVLYGNAPTYINATSFSVAGDQTPTFQVNRRLKSANTGGTIYSRITASSFAGSITTVTVANDSGSLDSGLSTVSYGLLSNTNPSIPETSGAKALRTLGAGVLLDRAYAEYTANANLTTVIPGDDTIPQNTEGTEVLSVSFTPKSATSRVRLRFEGCVAADTANLAIGAAIFSSASANALRAGIANPGAIGNLESMLVEHEYVPGVTTALTFSVRVGPLTAGTVRMNGSATARFFGGTMAATLMVEEFAA